MSRDSAGRPFLVKCANSNQAGWIPTGQLIVGNGVVTSDGSRRKVTATTPLEVEQTVYNSDNVSGVESSARMMLIFGFIALTLAAAGIFAVMTYSVAQRTQEIGIRMALGARRFDVLRLVMASALKMAVVGLTFGLCVSLLLTHAISAVLYGVIRIEPPIFALLTSLLAIVAAVAAYIPARWATKVDPMQALRCE